jgi:predicted DNA binding protein
MAEGYRIDYYRETPIFSLRSSDETPRWSIDFTWSEIYSGEPSTIPNKTDIEKMEQLIYGMEWQHKKVIEDLIKAATDPKLNDIIADRVSNYYEEKIEP